MTDLQSWILVIEVGVIALYALLIILGVRGPR